MLLKLQFLMQSTTGIVKGWYAQMICYGCFQCTERFRAKISDQGKNKLRMCHYIHQRHYIHVLWKVYFVFHYQISKEVMRLSKDTQYCILQIKDICKLQNFAFQRQIVLYSTLLFLLATLMSINQTRPDHPHHCHHHSFKFRSRVLHDVLCRVVSLIDSFICWWLNIIIRKWPWL